MKRNFIDQIGQPVTIESYPQRIISLVPSQTELLACLKLDKEVAGITKFCVHPEEWYRTKNRVGGTKNVNFSKIEQINPDLILCNKEENKESDVKQLMKKYPVWTSDIHTLNDAFEMIASIGDITGKSNESIQLIAKIKSNFEEFKEIAKEPKRVLYLIWQKPFMAAGKDTFINYLLSQCNFINVCDKEPGRYPELNPEKIRSLNPQLLLLSSEPFPFKEKQLEEFNKYYPGILTVLVDGEYFSWYGSRLLKAPDYFKQLLEKIINLNL